MIQIVNKKRFFLVIFVIVALIAGIVWGIVKFKNRNNPENQSQVYEALVNIVDQKASDPVEDARSSLKKGDVIAYFPEGHSWSDTEKNSYLVVKIKIKPEDATKLLEAEMKKAEKREEDLREGEKDVSAGDASRSDEGGGPQMETVRARKYRLDLPDFDLQKFWGGGGQPFEGKIFSDSIIDKK